MNFETFNSIKDMVFNNAIVNTIKDNSVYSVNLGRLILDIGPVMNDVFNIQMAIGGYWPRRKDKLYLEPAYHDVATDKKHGLSQIRFYKGTPIWLTITIRHSRGGDDFCLYVLNTINKKKHIETLEEFIMLMVERGERYNITRGKTLTTLIDPDGGSRVISKDLRTFDDVYLDDELEKSIKNNIDRFIKNRQWFLDHSIPHHFGFLLYGPPSSGKSVLAQAIAKYANARLFKINGDDILNLPEMLNREIPSSSRHDDDRIVILIEDIDCGFTSGLEALFGKKAIQYDNSSAKSDDKDATEDPNKNNVRKMGMAALLNCLDGLDAPDNAIYVMTTNHVDKLDPALIRPGRCDAKYEIGYINRCQFDKFCVKFYGKKSEEEFSIKDKLTIASLQIEAMNGTDFEELVEKVKN